MTQGQSIPLVDVLYGAHRFHVAEVTEEGGGSNRTRRVSGIVNCKCGTAVGQVSE